MHPGPHRRALLETVKCSPRAQVRVLHEVLRLGDGAGHLVAVGKQLSPVGRSRCLETLGLRLGHDHNRVDSRERPKEPAAAALLKISMASQHEHDQIRQTRTRRDCTHRPWNLRWAHRYRRHTPALLRPLRERAPGRRGQTGSQRDPPAPHLSVLATTNADGSPQMAVVFVKAEGDDIVFSTLKGRRKTRNMWRDPRANLLVHSLPVGDEASTYATISGRVELTDDPDGSFHQVMYDIHMGGATPPPEPGAKRVIVRLRPEKIHAPPTYSSAPDQ